jgi:hypothetical protein
LLRLKDRDDRGDVRQRGCVEPMRIAKRQNVLRVSGPSEWPVPASPTAFFWNERSSTPFQHSVGFLPKLFRASAVVTSRRPGALSTDQWQLPVPSIARRAFPRERDASLRERIHPPELWVPFLHVCVFSLSRWFVSQA